MPNCQSNLVIALGALSLLFCIFVNTTAYHWADMSLHLSLAVVPPGWELTPNSTVKQGDLSDLSEVHT